LLADVEIWFVGLTTLDVIHRGAAPAHRNQKVTATWQEVSAGGPAANAAVVAAALGARATLLTALGSSPAAAVARADLTSHGVDIVDFADDDFQFPVSAILVDENTSERSVVSLDGSGWGSKPIAGGALVPALAALKAGSPPAVVLFDGHHPNIVRTMLPLLPKLPETPQVILDGGRWRDIFTELLPVADVAALSSDFRIPGGFDGRYAAQPPSANQLAGALQLGARAVVVTKGPEPVVWCRAAERGQLQERCCVIVPPTDAKDTLGAGDAFHGALAYYLATGAELPVAIKQAVQVATTKVQHLGNRTWLKKLRAKNWGTDQ